MSVFEELVGQTLHPAKLGPIRSGQRPLTSIMFGDWRRTMWFNDPAELRLLADVATAAAESLEGMLAQEQQRREDEQRTAEHAAAAAAAAAQAAAGHLPPGVVPLPSAAATRARPYVNGNAAAGLAEPMSAVGAAGSAAIVPVAAELPAALAAAGLAGATGVTIPQQAPGGGAVDPSAGGPLPS